MKWAVALSTILLPTKTCISQDAWQWDHILSKSQALSAVASAPDKYKLQLICSEVNRTANGDISFDTHYYHCTDSNYFYPASIVKFPASIFTLEKIHELQSAEITMNSEIHIDSSYQCQSRSSIDPYANDSIQTLASYIEKALIVSDNPSYSRLYEFVGPSYFSRRFNEMRMNRAAIRHRFSNCDSIANRHTNPFHFIGESGDTIYTQQADHYRGHYPTPTSSMLVGKSHESGGRIIQKPKSFEMSNALPLANIHAILMELIYPESQSFDFTISNEQRLFLIEKLKQMPRQASNRKVAQNKDFHDNYTNYLFFGQENKPRTSNIEVCNIVGLAYGFMTDVCYMKDTLSGTEFFLSATLYLNESNKFGSGNYEYNKLGFPFLKELGWSVKDELEKD
jgi:hypothetical protein